MSSREEIIGLLRERKFDALVADALGGKNFFRTLISLSYDKDDVLSWRAIEGVGVIAGELAKHDEAKIRNLAQRLLWMMRDESGNNVGSAPELLGEIVRNSPDRFADIAPIIASFHDEVMLRRGVLFALIRIAEVRPDLLSGTPLSFLPEFLEDKDPFIRAYAVLLAGRLGRTDLLDAIVSQETDTGAVTLYRDGGLAVLSVGQIAGETVIMLHHEKGS